MPVTPEQITNLENKRKRLEDLLKKQHELNKPESGPLVGEGNEGETKTGKAVEDTDRLMELLKKQIKEEIQTIEDIGTKERPGDWAEWWNLWVFGYIAGVVTNIVLAIIKRIRRDIEDPEKLLDDLKELIKALK